MDLGAACDKRLANEEGDAARAGDGIAAVDVEGRAQVFETEAEIEDGAVALGNDKDRGVGQ